MAKEMNVSYDILTNPIDMWAARAYEGCGIKGENNHRGTYI